MPTTDAPELVTRRLDFAAMSGFPDLFRRYVAGDAAALDFFARDVHKAEDLKVAVEEAAALERDRDTLADVLLEQNAHWSNLDETVLANIQALRKTDSAAVVTGQQLGLFGGPLYTVYKAATAVRLARQLTEDTGRTVVPVFWMAGEDHDFDEVRGTLVLNGDDPVRVALDADESRTPVGRRTLGGDATAAIDALEETLRPTEFTPGMLDALREAYRPGAMMRDAFAGWMQYLFAGSGLVFISSDDARLKRVVADVFRQEIERPDETFAAVKDASERLEAAGFHQQVTPLPGNLFLMEPEGRFTLDPEGDGFALRGLDRHYSTQELLALLDSEPERFSPNVVMRPIIEDRLLPTAAYVAGPGEASYYAQLKGVYDLFGVPMPVVYPRASVTLVEPKVQKVLDRYDLSVGDLGGDLDALQKRIVLDRSEHDLAAAFDAARQHLNAALAEVKPVAVEVDATLEKSAEATRAALHKALSQLEERVVRAEKRNHEVVRDRLDRAHARLYPTGTPQERALSVLYFVNTYGPGLVADWIEGLDLDTTEHQVIEL